MDECGYIVLREMFYELKNANVCICFKFVTEENSCLNCNELLVISWDSLVCMFWTRF